MVCLEFFEFGEASYQPHSEAIGLQIIPLPWHYFFENFSFEKLSILSVSLCFFVSVKKHKGSTSFTLLT